MLSEQMEKPGSYLSQASRVLLLMKARYQKVTLQCFSNTFLGTNRILFCLSQEIPETPKVITGSETDLIFFWKAVNSKNYFSSAAYPELFIATKEQSEVHLARGLPSMTDFQIA